MRPFGDYATRGFTYSLRFLAFLLFLSLALIRGIRVTCQAEALAQVESVFPRFNNLTSKAFARRGGQAGQAI